jgi:hypothetical protein
MINSLHPTLRPVFRLASLANGTASTTSDTIYRLARRKADPQSGVQAINHRLLRQNDSLWHYRKTVFYKEESKLHCFFDNKLLRGFLSRLSQQKPQGSIVDTSCVQEGKTERVYQRAY